MASISLVLFRDHNTLSRPEINMFGSLQREIDRLFDHFARSIGIHGTQGLNLVRSNRRRKYRSPPRKPLARKPLMTAKFRRRWTHGSTATLSMTRMPILATLASPIRGRPGFL